MAENIPPSLGAIYTPPDFAYLPTAWAIQNNAELVLDVGVGEGVFTIAALKRLIELGAPISSAQQQVYGAEIYLPAFETFKSLCSELGVHFNNIYQADFFKIAFPEVNAVVGNPPWVRRTYLDNVEEIRQEALSKLDSFEEEEFSKLSDLYVYCLIKATSHLKPGGRLAVVTSDSWLNTKYGKSFKDFLLENFVIEHLVSFDRQIFDAQVRALFIFATRRAEHEEKKTNEQVRFIRVKDGLPASAVLELINNPKAPKSDIGIRTVKSHKLKSEQPWGVHFKASEICEFISKHKSFTPLSKIAATRIGIQTLAKEFFVFSADEARSCEIEGRYLEPLAHSPKDNYPQLIETGSRPVHYLFYCAKTKNALRGTKALKHIEAGEHKVVPVRGKNITVTGYQNKKRIKEDGRKYWYDLQTKIERRGRWEILIPRLLYRSFKVLWNKAKFVPGELFIECSSKLEPNIPIEVILAVLNCSLTELQLRAYAQLYGGGTSNISPGEIRKLPVLNVSKLTAKQRSSLRQAYLHFLADPRGGRNTIDKVVYEVLDFDLSKQEKVKQTLDDLVILAVSSKKKRSK